MTQVSSLWTTDIPDGWMEQLLKVLTSAGSGERPLQVFFRSDDIARVDPRFTGLMELFMGHQVPLNLALVPTWMTRQRWDEMAVFERSSPLWCWHQHGYSHQNHAVRGKKYEFGNSRPPAAIKQDLLTGWQRLHDICGPALYPVFTPPWNRCGRNTLDLLAAHNFRAVSRSAGAEPLAPESLPDLAVNVDLHTRKEEDSRQGWNNLFNELKRAARTGRIGVMLHHQLMNERSFSFLDQLLPILGRQKHLRLCSFRDLLA